MKPATGTDTQAMPATNRPENAAADSKAADAPAADILARQGG
jgi:hypothetical protein